MKKVFSALLCLLFVLSLCACADKNKDSEKTVLERGETANGVYKNSFANLHFNAPQNWSYASNTDLLAITEHDGNRLDSERLNEIFAEFGTAYDMTCYSDDGIHSVSVIFINNNHEQFSDYSTTKELLDKMIAETTLDTSGGITSEEITLCGEIYLRLCVKTKTGTGDTGYATFYGRKQDSTTVLIVAACTDSFTVADCEACFK